MTTSPARTPASDWEKGRAPAEAYERDLVPALFAPWARDLVNRLDPGPGERVLDLACGTGVVARLAAARVFPSGTVTGVDVNPGMLDVARRVADAEGLRIEWRQAGAERTGLADAGFDVAFCEQGLQFFGDRAAALRELHRLVAPGGRIGISVWCHPASPGYAPFWSAFARHVPDAVGFLRAIFSLDDETELAGLLDRAGFRGIAVSRRTRLVRCASPEDWARAFLGAAPNPAVAGLPVATRDRIIEEVAGSLRGRSDGHGVAFPVYANVAVAHR